LEIPGLALSSACFYENLMSYECFDVETHEGITEVRLNRPEALNSMLPSFWTELPQIIRELDAGSETRVIVLSSTGKHFCAGMDLSVFTSGGGALSGETQGEVGRQRANFRRHILKLQETFSSLEKARVPVLAAIQGGAIGGAVDMITACDMRYMSEEAFICIQEINIGMTADVGTLQRLPKIIPEGVARELSYTGRRMPAAEAKACGLVNEVFPNPEALRAGVMAVAKQIASKSPLAVWGTKEMINYSRDHSVEDSLNYIATWQTGMFQPADMAESFRAKSEKRNPEFENLLPASKPI
jgi:enoyl-CoA hydratase